MTDETSNQEQQNTNEEQQESTQSKWETTDAWVRVGKQFQILGDTIASAVTTSLQSEESKQQLDRMRTEFETAANQLSRAVRDTLESEHAQQMRAETEKFTRSAQETGQEVMLEIKPQLVAAFRMMQAGLDQIITTIETQPAKSTPTPESDPAESESNGDSTESE